VLGILVTGILIVTSLGMCRTEVSSQRIRMKAPNFSLQDTSGKTFKLSNQIGSPVVIFSARHGVLPVELKCLNLKNFLINMRLGV